MKTREYFSIKRKRDRLNLPMTATQFERLLELPSFKTDFERMFKPILWKLFVR